MIYLIAKIDMIVNRNDIVAFFVAFKIEFSVMSPHGITAGRHLALFVNNIDDGILHQHLPHRCRTTPHWREVKS
jgi:hypothetical protein